MSKKEHHQDSVGAVQKKFTAYVTRAVYRRRLRYLRLLTKRLQKECIQEECRLNAITADAKIMEEMRLLQMLPEIEALRRILKTLPGRERDIFLSRVLDEREFKILAEKYGLTYKAATAMFIRTLRKIRKQMGVYGDEF